MICDNCGDPVTMNRRENRTLEVSCDCDARSIKVATVLPDGWSE